MASKRAIKARKHECVSEKVWVRRMASQSTWLGRICKSTRFHLFPAVSTTTTCLPSQQSYKHADHERLLPHSFCISTSDKHTEQLPYLRAWSINLSWIFLLASGSELEPTRNSCLTSESSPLKRIFPRRGAPILISLSFKSLSLSHVHIYWFQSSWFKTFAVAEPSEVITPTTWWPCHAGPVHSCLFLLTYLTHPLIATIQPKASAWAHTYRLELLNGYFLLQK